MSLMDKVNQIGLTGFFKVPYMVAPLRLQLVVELGARVSSAAVSSRSGFRAFSVQSLEIAVI